MIRIIDFRVVVEKNGTHEKYYPKVISFNTVDDSPLSEPPSATITVFASSNLNNATNVSQIEFDDIIRLQVSVRYHILESIVWVDIFEGRVENQSKKFGTNKEIQFECKGHIAEAYYEIITADTTWANADATVIMQAVDTYMSRVKFNSNYATSGTIVTEYNVRVDQNYVIDVYKEMEKLSGYKKIIDVVPVYNSSGNLQTCYLQWRPLSSTPTQKYAIIEGTPRLISASFDISGDEVYNYYHVHGEEVTDGYPYAGSAYLSDSVDKYGARHKSETFAWIKSNQLCTDIAKAYADDNGMPAVIGQAVLEGTPDAKKGDLVNVYIPSLEVKGAQVNGTYTVYRVTNSFQNGAYTTTLDLGKIKKTEYDYISRKLTQVVRTCYKNQVRR